MVRIAQLVRASDCGSEGRGFESHFSPMRLPVKVAFFCFSQNYGMIRGSLKGSSQTPASSSFSSSGNYAGYGPQYGSDSAYLFSCRDRFHVQKLAFEAVQEMRIKARWEAPDKETVEIAYAKASGQPFIAEIFSNGDSCKQLLARSRYLLFKKESLWSEASKKGPKYFFVNILKLRKLTIQV